MAGAPHFYDVARPLITVTQAVQRVGSRLSAAGCAPGEWPFISLHWRFPRTCPTFSIAAFSSTAPPGRLEALLWTTRRPHRRAPALVCHPHPLFGGTLHNKVVFQTAKALHARGFPVLRFNFRGAGLSEGVHDKGHGETGDVPRHSITWRKNFRAAQFSWQDSALALGWDCRWVARTPA